jgi:hypothetical protein
VAYGCLLYILLGILLLRRVLLHFFDERWTALVLALVVLGTNFLHLAAWDGTLLTHPLLFTLYVLLVLATIRWHAQPHWRHALLIGLSGGMIALVRPPEAVVMLVPLLWAMHGTEARRRKWRLWRTHPVHLLLAVSVFGLMLLPQLIYWKAMTGAWITNSYANNPGEGFDLWQPHLRPFLASFRKGWFIYTPLMLLAVAGIPLLRRRHAELLWPLAAVLILHLWVSASWTTWWYAGGSFSARSMVPLYALLAVPLGLMIHSAMQWRMLRSPVILLVAALVLLNLFQTWQWKQGIISKERMTRAYYFAVFGRTAVPPGAEELLLVERGTTSEGSFTDEQRYAGRVLYEEDRTAREAGALVLTAEAPFHTAIDMPYRDITHRDHAWIRATTTLWVDSTTASPPLIVMAFHHKDEIGRAHV